MKTLKTMARALALAAVPALAAMATPAAATPQPPAGTYLGGCVDTLTTPNAIDCNGYYSQNVLNGSSADVTLQQGAISSLGGTWNGDWTALVNAGLVLSGSGDLSGPQNNELNFGQTMYGLTIIGAHYGNIPDPSSQYGNVSVFWLFDFGTQGANYITLNNTQGWSNAALYTTGRTPGVPEPATWAMMLVGFGAIGFAMRRRSSARKALPQLA